MPIRLLVFVAVLLGAWVGEGPAARAHPHVWIDARLSVAFDDQGRMAALKVVWRLDELYSQTAIAGLDLDADGAYAPSELQPLVEEAVVNLEEWFYYADIRAGDQRVATGPAEDNEAYMDGDRLVYAFTIPVDEPLRPGQTGVRVRLFDPSLFIGIELEKEAPVVLARAPRSCGHGISRAPGFDEALLIGENVFTDDAEPGTEGLGGRFAETVTITCD